jgi:hypothetical protein
MGVIINEGAISTLTEENLSKSLSFINCDITDILKMKKYKNNVFITSSIKADKIVIDTDKISIKIGDVNV